MEDKENIDLLFPPIRDVSQDDKPRIDNLFAPEDKSRIDSLFAPTEIPKPKPFPLLKKMWGFTPIGGVLKGVEGLKDYLSEKGTSFEVPEMTRLDIAKNWGESLFRWTAQALPRAYTESYKATFEDGSPWTALFSPFQYSEDFKKWDKIASESFRYPVEKVKTAALLYILGNMTLSGVKDIKLHFGMKRVGGVRGIEPTYRGLRLRPETSEEYANRLSKFYLQKKISTGELASRSIATRTTHPVMRKLPEKEAKELFDFLLKQRIEVNPKQAAQRLKIAQKLLTEKAGVPAVVEARKPVLPMAKPPVAPPPMLKPAPKLPIVVPGKVGAIEAIIGTAGDAAKDLEMPRRFHQLRTPIISSLEIGNAKFDPALADNNAPFGKIIIPSGDKGNIQVLRHEIEHAYDFLVLNRISEAHPTLRTVADIILKQRGDVSDKQITKAVRDSDVEKNQKDEVIKKAIRYRNFVKQAKPPIARPPVVAQRGLPGISPYLTMDQANQLHKDMSTVGLTDNHHKFAEEITGKKVDSFTKLTTEDSALIRDEAEGRNVPLDFSLLPETKENIIDRERADTISATFRVAKIGGFIKGEGKRYVDQIKLRRVLRKIKPPGIGKKGPTIDDFTNKELSDDVIPEMVRETTRLRIAKDESDTIAKITAIPGLKDTFFRINTPQNKQINKHNRIWDKKILEEAKKPTFVKRPSMKLRTGLSTVSMSMNEWADYASRKLGGIPIDKVIHDLIDKTRDFYYWDIVLKEPLKPYFHKLSKKDALTAVRLIEEPESVSEKDINKNVLEIRDAFNKVNRMLAPIKQWIRFRDWFYSRKDSKFFEIDAIQKKGKDWLSKLSLSYIHGDIAGTQKMLSDTNVGLISKGYFKHIFKGKAGISRSYSTIDKVGGQIMSRTAMDETFEHIEQEVGKPFQENPVSVVLRDITKTLHRYHIQPGVSDLSSIYSQIIDKYQNIPGLKSVLTKFVDRCLGLRPEGIAALRYLIGKMLRARLMIPTKWLFRNPLQRFAIDPVFRDHFKSPPGLTKNRNLNILPEKDREYLFRRVLQTVGLEREHMYRGEYAKRQTAYTTSDDKNRIRSFGEHLFPAKKALGSFGIGKRTAAQMFYDTHLNILQEWEQKRAIEILANKGQDEASRFIAERLCFFTHFEYSRIMRSPWEQTGAGEMLTCLIPYSKGLTKRWYESAKRIFVGGTGTGHDRMRAGILLAGLVAKAAIMGTIYTALTGVGRKRRSAKSKAHAIAQLVFTQETPYDPRTLFGWSKRGSAFYTLPKELIVSTLNFADKLSKGDTTGAIKELDRVPKSYLPYYANVCYAIEAIEGTRYDGVLSAIGRRIEDTLPSKRNQIDRNLLRAIQHTITGGDLGADSELTDIDWAIKNNFIPDAEEQKTKFKWQ